MPRFFKFGKSLAFSVNVDIPCFISGRRSFTFHISHHLQRGSGRSDAWVEDGGVYAVVFNGHHHQIFNLPHKTPSGGSGGKLASCMWTLELDSWRFTRGTRRGFTFHISNQYAESLRAL